MLTGRKGFVVAAFMVGLDDDIVAVSSGGVMIRMPVRDISSQGRDATGVRVLNRDDDTREDAVEVPTTMLRDGALIVRATLDLMSGVDVSIVHPLLGGTLP